MEAAYDRPISQIFARISAFVTMLRVAPAEIVQDLIADVPSRLAAQSGADEALRQLRLRVHRKLLGSFRLRQ